MMAIKEFIKRHSLTTYFALTFAISWGTILIVVDPGGIPVTTEQLEVLGLAMLLGPSIAGILLTGLVYGRAGLREFLRRLLKWRVDIRWYAVAILIAPLLTAIVLLALSFLYPEFLPVIFTTNDKVTLLLTGIAAGFMVGLFEEFGWTGFAVNRIRLHYGVITTGLIVGLLWGAWHFILFWESDSFSGVLPLALLLARLFSWLPAYRVLMVWVYDYTKSLLIAIIMHVSLVASTVIIEPPLKGTPLLTYILIRAVVLWVIVAAVAMVKGGRFSRQPQPGWED